jgi:hypothetical protein
LLASFCAPASLCGTCTVAACENRVIDILERIRFADARTEIWRGSFFDRWVLEWFFDTVDYCHQWNYNFGHTMLPAPTSCLDVKDIQLGFKMPPAKWESHSIAFVRNRCTGRCLIIDNLGPLRDPCSLKTAPGAADDTWLDETTVMKWENLRQACGCGAVATPGNPLPLQE